jgi:hypothetical protein
LRTLGNGTLRRIRDHAGGRALHVDDVAYGLGLPRRSDGCSGGNGGIVQ